MLVNVNKPKIINKHFYPANIIPIHTKLTIRRCIFVEYMIRKCYCILLHLFYPRACACSVGSFLYLR